MPNKTIYVSDDDVLLLDEAQEVSGSNLSSTIAVALRQFVAAAQATGRGYREVTVRVGDSGSTRRQRFRGRRLARWRHVAAQSRRAEVFAVYQTEKGRFAVHIQRGPESIGWNDPEDESGGSLQMMAAWREHLAKVMRMTTGQRPSRPAIPQSPPWDGWREAWPTSGGTTGDWGTAVATLEVCDSLDALRERFPTELCDLIERALGTPEVEDLDI